MRGVRQDEDDDSIVKVITGWLVIGQDGVMAVVVAQGFFLKFFFKK